MSELRRAVDTNVLIYAHLPSFPDHEVVRRYLLEQLRPEGVKLVVTPLVLHEFVRVVTDGRRFEPLISIGEATAIVRL